MKVHFVVHEAYEAPGAYEAWVRERGYAVSHSRVYAGEFLPQSVNEIDLLVVLGGPQSPATTTDECPYFDSAAEQALIAKCVDAKKAVVGVCLGAQLVGAALGAAHARSPEREIGVFPITLTLEGRSNPKFAGFDETLDVGHWHNDMPGLTQGATIIASSEGCPRQIIEYGDLVYGFQCHMEFTPEAIELLIAVSEQGLPRLKGRRFIQQADELRAQNYRPMNAALFGFLDRLMDDYEDGLSARTPGLASLAVALADGKP